MDNMIISFNITPVASGYQEIHPYSAMNIDSVKINTSLIMMKEWAVQCTSPPTSRFPSAFDMSFGLFPQTSLRPREILRSKGMYNPIYPDSRQCMDTLHFIGLIKVGCCNTCNILTEYEITHWPQNCLFTVTDVLLSVLVCVCPTPPSVKCAFISVMLMPFAIRQSVSTIE